ncbi:hypothetical protein Q8F55_008429 [Vanrija albida]|uniref:Uncharacterized protein n=1 Tax=Vanrija albida TaxID=181172 RepID=A0ABR3PQS3_9TREE
MTTNTTPSAPSRAHDLATIAQPSWWRHIRGERPADVEHLATLVTEGDEPVNAAHMLRLNNNDVRLARQALEHRAHEIRGDKFRPTTCPVCAAREKEAVVSTSGIGTVLRGGGVAAGVSSLVMSVSHY